MSTIKVNKIENTSTTDGGISIDNSGHVTVDGQQMPSAGPLSNRNLIINGAMQVAQRATSASGKGYTTLDRWKPGYSNTVSLQITSSQDSDSPEGFANSLKIDIDTADTFTADEEFYVEQILEGQNIQHFSYGSSSAKDVTLSFWVKSHVAGQYSIWFFSADTSRYFMKEYTVNASATWEYKTMTIPGDTVGAIDDDNGGGFSVRFYLGAGANYQTTVSTDWAANAQATRITSNQVQLQNSTNNYWQITGVQVEVGSVATPFEHRSFGDELARCQRYYEKSFSYSDAPGTATSTGALTHRKNAANSGYTDFNIRFGVRKRATPTIGLYNTNNSTEGQIRSNGANVTANDINTNEMGFGVNTDPAQAASAVQSMHYTVDAEL